jgi:hydroxymethylglutaryl-CoA lyase
MSDLPKSVEIIEVGPRDFLPIEPAIHSASGKKLQVVDALADEGLNEIETGSFVNPKAVPQRADTNELSNPLNRRVRYRALWLNPTGRSSSDTRFPAKL